MASNMTELACSDMKYFLWMGFIVTRIHCVSYGDVSHFSNSEDIWIFRVNCDKSLTDVLIKPLPVQKSTCLIIRLFNNLENNANESLHLSLPYMIVLIIFITSITLDILTIFSPSITLNLRNIFLIYIQLNFSGPSTALYEPFLKHCTLTNKAIGTLWRALSKPPQRRQGPDLCTLWLLVGTPSAIRPELAFSQAEHSRPYLDVDKYIFDI